MNQLQKKEVFNADGRNTFFIPVDEGFKVTIFVTIKSVLDKKYVNNDT